MKKGMILFGLLLLAFTQVYGNGTKFFNGTFDEAKVKALNEGKLILLNLTSGST